MMRNFDSFPQTEVVKLITDEYGITLEEFNSKLRYDPLPEARQLYCLSLARFGAKNKDICKLTRYTPGRVNYTIAAGIKLYATVLFFKVRCDKLLKYLLKLEP